MDLWLLANDESCLRHQAFWHSWQGPLVERQQSNNITLTDVLEGVHAYLQRHLDDFEIQEAFVTKELPLKLAQLRERWERYVVLNAELAARGRGGFERNRRDD
ncbi:hypothetical protein G682_01070 [Escherichia coli HVH 2 (4-6943160)]|nr:hypothetical protein G682_01070 [Escherichia coli HVH 2 (4-6943160)]